MTFFKQKTKVSRVSVDARSGHTLDGKVPLGGNISGKARASAGKERRCWLLISIRGSADLWADADGVHHNVLNGAAADPMPDAPIKKASGGRAPPPALEQTERARPSDSFNIWECQVCSACRRRTVLAADKPEWAAMGSGHRLDLDRSLNVNRRRFDERKINTLRPSNAALL